MPLFKPSMLKVWRIQRVHILRGCLSDPEVTKGILYRHGGTVQLNHVKGGGSSCTCVDPCERHLSAGGVPFPSGEMGHRHSGIHRTFPGAGHDWSGSLEFQRFVDLKQPGVKLPAVFDPVLIMELNKLSDVVTGQAKYPAYLSHRQTPMKGLDCSMWSLVVVLSP